VCCRGNWVHIFPEGRVGYTGRLQACKWGVGKLVCDSAQESGRCAAAPAMQRLKAQRCAVQATQAAPAGAEAGHVGASAAVCM
jgi:hypothetical protein